MGEQNGQDWIEYGRQLGKFIDWVWDLKVERDALRAELTEQGLMVASESRRALRAERERDQLRAELAALCQPAADNQQANQQAEREAFELECTRLGLSLIRRGQSGRYSPEIQCAWMLWQARAALSAPAAGQNVGALVEALECAITSMLDSGYSPKAVVILKARAALRGKDGE